MTGMCVEKESSDGYEAWLLLHMASIILTTNKPDIYMRFM